MGAASVTCRPRAFRRRMNYAALTKQLTKPKIVALPKKVKR